MPPARFDIPAEEESPIHWQGIGARQASDGFAREGGPL